MQLRWKRPAPEADAGDAAAGMRPSRGRPVDLVHLARQTLGDRDLEREVLGLMRRQLERCSARVDLADAAERRVLAHALKGAAQNVGAFDLSVAAEAVENGPADPAAIRALAGEVQRAERFIAALLG